MIHDLKTWPEPFQAIRDGLKQFEYRKDDRGFEVGHQLLLIEFDPERGRLTGRALMARVTYIARGRFGIPRGFCVMSIRVEKLL